jgi:hypothetical protein
MCASVQRRITAEQFEQAFAERFGLTIYELRALGRVVMPCDCEVDACPGWQSVNRELTDLVVKLHLAPGPTDP